MNYIRNHLRLTIFGIVLIVALLIGIPIWGETSSPPSDTPPDTTPEPPKDIIVPTPTGELRVTIFEATGESTKGALIEIAGKKIQLPPDAYIAHDIIDVVCVLGSSDPCPETPYYVLARSNSTIAVSTSSGIIHEEKIGEGDKEPFAFLKEALR